MNNGSVVLSKTTRQPFGPITTLPEARVGLKEVLSIALVNTQHSDEKEIFALIVTLLSDIIRVVNAHGSMAQLAETVKDRAPGKP